MPGKKEIAKVEPGTRVRVRWDPAGVTEKVGLLVRYNGAGNPVVRIVAVDAKGRSTGRLGSPRMFKIGDILGPANEV